MSDKRIQARTGLPTQAMPAVMMDRVKGLDQKLLVAYESTRLHINRRPWPPPPTLNSLRKISATILELIGCTGKLLTRLRTESRPDWPGGQDFNLGHLDRCARDIDVLLLTLDVPESPSGVSPRFPSLGELNRHNQSLSVSDARIQTALKLDDLVGVLVFLSLPAGSDTQDGSFSEPERLLVSAPMRIASSLRPRQKLLSVLCRDDFSTPKLHDVLRSRCHGTHKWVFEDERINAWKAGNMPRLWITGEPGCGKSTLAATITEHLLTNVADETTSVCYMFLDHDRLFTREIFAILSTLLAQLASQSLEAFTAALDMFGISSPDQDLWYIPDPGEIVPKPPARRSINFRDPGVLIRTLAYCLTKFKTSYIIVDGIDDAHDKDRLAGLLQELTHPSIKLLVAGRSNDPETSEEGGQSSWSGFERFYLSARPEDVSAFVENTARTKSLQGSKNDVNADTLQHMARTLSTTGNFCSAKCIMRLLLALESDQARQTYISMFPPSLDATYGDIMLQAGKADIPRGPFLHHTSLSRPSVAEHLNTLLSWVSLLSRITLDRPHMKISRGALFEALSVAMSPTAERLEDLPSAVEVEAIFSSYLNIFTFDKNRADGDKYNFPLHRTARDYLRGQEGPPAGDEPFILDSIARKSLAEAALRFVNFRDFRALPEGCKLVQQQAIERQADHPFYIFAAAWWPELCFPESGGILTNLAIRLFMDPLSKGNFINWWLEFSDFHFPWRYSLRTLPSTSPHLIALFESLTKGSLKPFHIAAALGLDRLCEALLSASAIRASPFGPPLLLAIFGPRIFGLDDGQRVTDFYGALNTQDTRLISIRPRQTIELLLQSGADVGEFVDRGDGTPCSLASNLFFACASLRDADFFMKIAQRGILLDHIFYHTLESFRFSTSGIDPYDQVTNTLARWNVRTFDANSIESKFLTKICEYLIDGHITAIFQNAEQGLPLPKIFADGNGTDGAFSAAWQCAAEHGLRCSDPKEVRSINCTDEQYFALRESVLRSFDAGVLRRLMQDPRFDPDQPLSSATAEDESAGQTALHLAVEADNFDMVRLLLDNFRSIDFSVRDAQGRTPLHLAESSEMLMLLLRRGGMDTYAQEERGKSVWHVAAANNDDSLLQVLVHHGREFGFLQKALRQQTKEGRTPLAEALAFFYHHERWAATQMPEKVLPRAALVLLPLCQEDPICFESDIPVWHLVAAWGCEPLLQAMNLISFVDKTAVTDEGETPFHFLGHFARAPFVSALMRVLGPQTLALTTKAGKTAIDTFLESLIKGYEANAQYFECLIDQAAFNMLLVPGIVEHQDSEGLTLWNRVCNTILFFPGKLRSGSTPAVQSINLVVNSLIDAGVIQAFEEKLGRNPLFPLLGQISTSAPRWFGNLTHRILDVMKQPFNENAKSSGSSVGCLLQWAFAAHSTDLARALLSRGVSVYDPGQSASVLGDFTFLDLEMLDIALEYADITKINTPKYSSGLAPIHTLLSDTRPNPQREQKLRALLRAGADPNLRTTDGVPVSPLGLAAKTLQEDCAITLLEFGADSSKKLWDGFDIWLFAASRGCLRLLRKLQELKSAALDRDGTSADGSATSLKWPLETRCAVSLTVDQGLKKKSKFHGCHALHLAALNNHVGIVRHILNERLVPVNEPCFDTNMTALHFAAIGGASSVIRILVEMGADMNACDPDLPTTALHLAVKTRNPDAVRTLLDLGCEVDGPNANVVTPLILAIELNIPQCVDLLMPASIRGNGVSSQAKPRGPPDSLSKHQSAKKTRILARALELAIQKGDPSAVKAVLERDCPVDVTLPSCNGCSPLVLAVRNGRPDIVRMLFDHGATRLTGNCQKHSPKGINVVFEAAMRPTRTACLRLVLNAALRLGQNWVNAQVTPIHVAAQEKNFSGVAEIIKHLADNGEAYRRWIDSPLVASNSTNDESSKTVHPVVRYMVNRHITMTENENYYPDNATALHLAMGAEDQQTADLLLKNGADINCLDTALSTPLHRAVLSADFENVRFLLSRGAAVDRRNQDGYSPLMLAARAGYVDICQELIEEGGADPHIRDADGMSLLSCCAEISGSPALFAYLVSPKVGLDPYARDKTTYCPLHDAILNNKMTGYVLAGHFDMWRVAEGPDLMKGLFCLIIEDGAAELTLPRLYRRWPRHQWNRYVNAAPERYVSPLCVAAIRGYVWEVEWLLEHEADLELEGCAEGTALMTACAHGRAAVVELLVLRGRAKIAYRRPSNAGSGGCSAGDESYSVRNAVELAAPFPVIVHWLLVGRFTSQPKLAARASPDTENKPLSPWSGGGSPRVPWEYTVPWALTGTNRDYPRAHKESLRSYLERIEAMKMKMRGTVVVPYTEDQLIPVVVNMQDSPGSEDGD